MWLRSRSTPNRVLEGTDYDRISCVIMGENIVTVREICVSNAHLSTEEFALLASLRFIIGHDTVGGELKVCHT
jgi:hypothetical protein